MIILHIITGLNYGGAERNLINLLNNKNQENLKYYVISLSDEGYYGKNIKDLKIPLICLKINKQKNIFFKFVTFIIAIVKVCILINKIKPSIIQTWLHHSDLFGLIVCFITRHKKLIWSVRCSYLDRKFISYKNKIVVKILSFFSRFPYLIIFNSELGLKAHIEEGYSPKKYKIIFNGVDTNFFKPDVINRNNIKKKLNIDGEARVIGYIGKYDKIKDIDTFLLTVKVIQSKINNIKIIMAGKDLDNSNLILINKIKKHKLQNILLLGNYEKINLLILAFDLLLLTSISEGLPNVILESMSSGIPCVSTNAGDVKKILRPEFIHDIGDYKNLANSSYKILNLDKHNKIELKNSIRKKIINDFNIFNISKQYQNTYNEILNNG